MTLHDPRCIVILVCQASHTNGHCVQSWGVTSFLCRLCGLGMRLLGLQSRLELQNVPSNHLGCSLDSNRLRPGKKADCLWIGYPNLLCQEECIESHVCSMRLIKPVEVLRIELLAWASCHSSDHWAIPAEHSQACNSKFHTPFSFEQSHASFHT